MRREGALPDPAIYMWPSRAGDLLVFPGYNIYMVGGLAHTTFLLYWSHVIYVLYKSIGSSMSI